MTDSKTFTSAITETSDRHVYGWFETDRIDGHLPLRLLIDGKAIELIADVQEDEKSSRQDVKTYSFAFESNEPFSLSTWAMASVMTGAGILLPPSPVLINMGGRSEAKRWSLSAIDTAIGQHIENHTASKDLLISISLLASWFGHAVDRLNAIQIEDENNSRLLQNMLREPRHFGGAIQHLLGIVATNYETIPVPSYADPDVSIIIPVHNAFQFTYECIRSLVKLTDRVSYEIIVVDDCSSDETLIAKVVFDGPLSVVRTERNLGFVGACNAGATVARGSYLLFLNNDTIIRSSSWLWEMVATFDRFDRVGVVGARLLFEDGSLQECGGIVWRDGSAWNYGRNGSPTDWRFRYAREADYVSGACLMISKKVFFDIGRFNTEFSPAYYEDTDICFNVRRLGFRVIVQPAATIFHLEGKSNGTDVSAGLKRYQVLNRSKFIRRWKETLNAHQENGQDLAAAINRYSTKIVLFIDDTMLTPDRDAGSNAAWEHIRSLQRLEYKVVFVPADNMADIQPYSLQLEAQGVECIYAPHFWSLEDFLRRDQRRYDLIYIHRFSNADRYLHLCRRLRPSARIIYNVADLHSLREARGLELSKKGDVFGATACVQKDREFSLIREADISIVHSPTERIHLANHGIRDNVHVVPWTIHQKNASSNYADTRDIAFIGGFRHAPNIDAVLWFFKEILNPLMGRDDEIHIRLIGSDMPPEFSLIKHPNVHVVGHVEDLGKALRHLRLTIAPLRYGAGLKGKVLTSLAYGVPCIMSPIAAEGIPLFGELSDLINETPADFVSAICRFYREEEAWTRLSRLGRSIISKDFSSASVDEKLGRALSYLNSARLQEHEFRSGAAMRSSE